MSSQPRERRVSEVEARIIAEIRVLQSYAESIRRSLEQVMAVLQETTITLQELSKIEEQLKESKEVLIPLGPMVLVRAEIVDPGRVVLNLGAGVYRDVSSSEARAKLEEYRKELEETASKMQAGLAAVLKRIQELQAVLASGSAK